MKHVLPAILFALVIGPVHAAPANGVFVTADACPALQSIRNGTNPGEVMTAPGEAYRITEVNNLGAPTHYRVVVPGASPPDRWVAIDCGSEGGEDVPLEAGPDRYMLAASWQPGFCETQPDKVECLDQDESRFDASHFALHGLWPQPQGRQYCEGASRRDIQNDRPATWRLLPEVALTAATRRELDKVMPGTASFLERHEWLVHGTCYGEAMQSYFSESLALMAQLNASPLREFMARNIGRSVTPEQIRAAVDEAFGRGAGNRVSIECKTEQDGNRRVLTELQIALYGAVDETSDLGELIRNARPQGSNSGQCPSVIVDRAGL